jgi:hypothetical protein
LDPAASIDKLKEWFPEVTVLPGDQLAASVKQIEEATVAERQKNPDSPLHSVLESERRKSRTFGPAYAFRLPLPEGGTLRGNARRYNVTFLFDDPLSESLRQRLIAFLQSFGVGWIKASTDDQRQSEILYDLRGTPEVANGSSANGLPAGVTDAQPAEAP